MPRSSLLGISSPTRYVKRTRVFQVRYKNYVIQQSSTRGRHLKSLTHQKISFELLRAQHRGVVITFDELFGKTQQLIDVLEASDGPTFAQQPEDDMHFEALGPLVLTNMLCKARSYPSTFPVILAWRFLPFWLNLCQRVSQDLSTPRW